MRYRYIFLQVTKRYITLTLIIMNFHRNTSRIFNLVLGKIFGFYQILDTDTYSNISRPSQCSLQSFRIPHFLRMSYFGDDVVERFISLHIQHDQDHISFRLHGKLAVRDLQDIHYPQPFKSYMALLVRHAVRLHIVRSP